LGAEPDLSIVVPVYNGAGTLHELSLRSSAVMKSMGLRFEFIFVEDGSGDRSWEVIRELKETYGEQVVGIGLARNCGQQAATLCGLTHASGTWVLTLDDDLQTLPEEIPRLWEETVRTRADVVYGTYASLNHGVMHNLGSRCFRILFSRLAPNYPGESSFRLIRGEILKSLPPQPGPWVLVDPMLGWLSANIVTVPVKHGKREGGRSRYSLFKLVGLAVSLIILYSPVPLRLMIWGGLISSLVSFGIGAMFLYQKLTVGSQVGFSALIVTMAFGFSLILFSLGILGEYISRIYAMGTGRPAFTVKGII
jgi:polyisoprenyl-phosphate glycosyltransferase